jgi:hypothetical protein
MRADDSRYIDVGVKNTTHINPRPGEIWELNRCLRSPWDFSTTKQQHLLSEPVLMFCEGKSSARYVMIVREPEAVINHQGWQEVSVMLLSGETIFLSDVDILIPKEISDVGQDLLAETWHILPMLSRNLLRPIGQRLSRVIYDVLMTIGDCDLNLRKVAPVAEDIQAVGLRVGTLKAQEKSEILAFHQQEKAWSEILTIPLSPYQSNLAAIKQAKGILDAALEIERLLQNHNPMTNYH